MDGPVDAASARKPAVGGVDDRVDFLGRDVALPQLKRLVVDWNVH